MHNKQRLEVFVYLGAPFAAALASLLFVFYFFILLVGESNIGNLVLYYSILFILGLLLSLIPATIACSLIAWLAIYKNRTSYFYTVLAAIFACLILVLCVIASQYFAEKHNTWFILFFSLEITSPPAILAGLMTRFVFRQYLLK
jgi:uncharacterized membrane protein